MNNFEEAIDPTILERGLAYFENGRVTEWEEFAPGEYGAQVIGNAVYQVELEVKRERIVSHQCECPYDWGPVCKHVVAAIFHLTQASLSHLIDSPKMPRKKALSPFQRFKKLLKEIPPDELMAFLVEHGKSNVSFRDSLVAQFSHYNEDQSKAFYQSQIRSIFKSSTNPQGFLGWKEMRTLDRGLTPLEEQAQKFLARGALEPAFFISSALIEESARALPYSDESNGTLEGTIYLAHDILHEIGTLENCPEKIRQETFQFCFNFYQKKVLQGLDIHMDMIALAAETAANESEADLIIKSLKTAKSRYEKKIGEDISLELIRRFKGNQASLDYRHQHLENPNFRTQEIEQAIKASNFETAKKLCEAGILQDQKDRPGLVIGWNDWLLKIAQAEGDSDKIVELARKQLLEDFNPQQDYYEVLRRKVPADQWGHFLEALLKELRESKFWFHSEVRKRILIREKMWERLFAMLGQHSTLENIEEYIGYLPDEYNEQLMELYAQSLQHFADNNIGRKNYQKIARYLRKMKKLGSEALALTIIQELKTKYPRRPALLEELARV